MNNQKNQKIPQKITVLLALMALVSILAAKEFFTEHVQGLSDQFNLTIADTWLIIFVLAVFSMVLISWFFTSIRISKK